MAKFEIYKSSNGEFRFRLVAGNGENILASEGYASKQGCQKGIESVKTNSTFDESYESKTAQDGRFYFVLKAANGEIIGNSQMYKTEESRTVGIAAVKNAANSAIIADQTV